MVRAIDLLASEYGWTKTYILESVYPDELIYFGEQISRRVIDQTLMDLRIASNPHIDPAEAKSFAQDLLDRRRAIYGIEDNAAPLDKEALELLKAQLKNTSKAIAVK